MKSKNQVVFWSAIAVFLTVLAGASIGNLVIAFYFVCFLFPIVLGTSLFFNRFLVPHYLLKNRQRKFWLYFTYMLIISIYLEMIVMILAFVILANYHIENLGGITSDIYLLTITLYLIVFADGFIAVLRRLKLKNRQLEDLEEQRKRNLNDSIIIKVNRKNVRLEVADILYIESFRDYVTVHTITKQYVTKQKIGVFEASLPDSFIRIHRSFLVNRKHVDSFNREQVNINNQSLTIGRTYKKECLKVLNGE